MPCKQFKDFNKETKDLVGKNFPGAGSWKVETKDKASDRTIAINPTAEWSAKKQMIAVDIDYNMKEFNLKTKTNVNAAGTIKPKVTYEPCAGHKVETTLMSLSADADFEITYEGEVAGATVFDKVTKKAFEGQASMPVGPLVVGASVAYGFSAGKLNWAAGARYSDKCCTVNVVTKDLKTYTTGVFAPIKLSCCTAKVAAQIDCGHGKCTGSLAAEAPFKCMLTGANLTGKVKINQDFACAVALIAKLANSWTAVVAVECKDVTKFGVQLTRE